MQPSPTFIILQCKMFRKKTVLGNLDRCPNSRISPWLLFDMAHRSWPGFCVQMVRGVLTLFFILPNITPERAEKLESPVNSRKCCRCWTSWSWVEISGDFYFYKQFCCFVANNVHGEDHWGSWAWDRTQARNLPRLKLRSCIRPRGRRNQHLNFLQF